MITNNQSVHYIGVPSLQTSVAGVELLTGNPRVNNLSFHPDQPCTIEINGDPAVYVKAAQVFVIPVCYSLKVMENGITFNYFGQLN